MHSEQTDEYCNIPATEKRDEDEDLRIIAELNNPRIYRDVKHVLRQEQRIKQAITRNKSLPFPCKCLQLCEFGSLLKILYDAFETLYEEYETLHYEYTILFRSSTFSVAGETIYLQESDSGFRSPDHLISSPSVNLSDVAQDAQLRPERKEAIENEELWRKTYELHMECVRLYMIQVAKPEQDRFMEWVFSHIWGMGKCICYHCDYRDALVSYRKALLSLHLEYLFIYAQYYALLVAPRVQESRHLTKALRLRTADSLIVKSCLN